MITVYERLELYPLKDTYLFKWEIVETHDDYSTGTYWFSNDFGDFVDNIYIYIC